MLALVLIGLFAMQDPDVDALLKQLEDESIEVREKAMAALIEAGDKAVTKIRARAESADAGVRMMCERILERIAIPKDLRQAIPPLRKVSISATDRPLKEVFEDFQGQTGLPLTTEGLPDGTVTLQVKDVTPLEALVAICKASRCSYYIDMGNKYHRGMIPAGGPAPLAGASEKPRIRIQPGNFVDVPRIFTRHYVVEPTNLSLTRSTNFQNPNSQAQVSLRLTWLPGMEPDSAYLDITSISDDQGRSLFQNAQREMRRYQDPYRGHGGGWNRGMTDQSVQMVFPENDARAIASIKGSAILRFIVGEKLVTFENPEKLVGEKREHGGKTLELLDWKQDGESLNVKFKLSGFSQKGDPWAQQRMDARAFRFKTEDGSQPVSNGWGGSGGGEFITMDMRYSQLKSKVLSVDVVMETQYQEDKFEFELKDIPLPK